RPGGVQGGGAGLSAGLFLPQPVVDQSQPRRRLRGNGCPWSDDSYQPGGGSGDGAAVVPPDCQQRPDHALHHSGHGGAGGSVALGWLSAVGARGAGQWSAPCRGALCSSPCPGRKCSTRSAADWQPTAHNHDSLTARRGTIGNNARDVVRCNGNTVTEQGPADVFPRQ